MSINPYEPPSELPSESEPEQKPIHEISTDHVGYEFAADWGPAGIKNRLVNPSKPSNSLGIFFAGLTLLILILSLGPLKELAGIACPLLFIWLLVFIAWLIPKLQWMSSTPNLYGFSGNVRGEITTSHLLVKGPTEAILSRRPVPHPFIFRSTPQVYLPFVSKMIPLLPEDIVRPITKLEASDEKNPIESLKRWCNLSNNENEIEVRDELQGTDLKKTSYRFQWIIASVVVGSIFALCLLAGLVSVLQFVGVDLFYFVSGTSRSRLDEPIAIGITGFIVAVFTGFLTKSLADRIWGSHGRFAAHLSKSTVIIQSDDAQRCYAFQGESLGHFNVTPLGVEIIDQKYNLVFLLPSRWFSEEELNQILQWQSEWPTLERNTYFGPRI